MSDEPQQFELVSRIDKPTASATFRYDPTSGKWRLLTPSEQFGRSAHG